MARNRDKLWWGILRKKLFRPSSVSAQKIMVVHTNNGRYSEEFNSSVYAEEDNACGSEFHSREDMAAIVIQSFFRGHLAKRAYRALKSLVKLQALVRGVMVRRQARLALQCMHALARLQITVRARQLLINNRLMNNH